jgi:hypothetical protein
MGITAQIQSAGKLNHNIFHENILSPLRLSDAPTGVGWWFVCSFFVPSPKQPINIVIDKINL